ncbi:MAG: CehA/McbA family metallohydrolase [Anaerolineae bacterium]|nr:CehA/McbA family metallohydrolase [Anaerolineae bacterium]
MSTIQDGPRSPHFQPLAFKGHANLGMLAAEPESDRFGLSDEMLAALERAPAGDCVCWGIPFQIGEALILSDHPVSIEVSPAHARWLVFLHTLDVSPAMEDAAGLISPAPRSGRLGGHAADYVISYADGSEVRAAIRRRHQIGTFTRFWGENCFEAVAQHKPYPVRGAQEQLAPGWGWTQTRVSAGDDGPWVNWLWAWENPHPEKGIVGFRFEPAAGGQDASAIILSGITAGDVASLPLRWQTRRKACLLLPEGQTFDPDLDKDGLLKQIQLDLGQVISATPRLIYPKDAWPDTYNNQLPGLSKSEILLEYTAHPEACFHLFGPSGNQVIPVSDVEEVGVEGLIQPVAPGLQRVTLRVIERGDSKPVPVKLHIHGEWDEYLAPVDRHRILNPDWFEDYSVDHLHVQHWDDRPRAHACTYIPGETQLKLPLGRVYVEVSKGFEIRPVRKVVEVTAGMQEIVIEIERVLPWRERGWVTADTHVHFLSPISAMLEGSAEGVNVVNLLASQWGEMMSNVGDFDGRNTWGSREAGGDGEYLVRVGTENRQHVLGHISLLGYQGPIIAPMTTAGPDESALGDPIEILLIEWARQCRRQGGLVVLPHFPHPRAEHAAGIISGDVDALEMTSLHYRYRGIDPYSLADWYRYLNCGYLVPAVGGTDKMGAATAVGTVRTYARIPPGTEFTYESWKQAVRRGETFVTYGPLLEFMVDGQPMGSRIAMSRRGGTADVTWQVASVTVPLSRVELVVNGEIRESVAVSPSQASGHWSVKVDSSAWLALLVRGHYPDQPEIVVAHSTPVMVEVEGSPLLAAADAVTIVDQVEGAMAYLDTVGTRAEDHAYKRMRLALGSAHRSLHNRLHQQGHYHEHTLANEHGEHH